MAEAIARYVPIAQWLPRYERGFLARDLLGGLAVWAVLVPQAVAYAALAGAPPQAGLFAALAAGIAYAVFGTCGQLDVGPSSTIAITSAAVLVPVTKEFPEEAYTSLLAALALFTGVVLVAAGLMRLGFVSEFLARPVLVGFISGVGVVIIAGQLPTLLGLTVQRGNVPETLWRTAKELGEVSWATLAIGAGALAALVVLRHFAPRVPWALLVAAVSVALSRGLDLESHGVAVIADVPAGLPSFGIPTLGVGEIGALSGGAAALALIAIAESIGAARSLAADRGYRIDPNQELVAIGASNAAAGFLQGLPVDASLSRSAVASGAGVRTRLSGLFVAVLLLATMLFLTPLFDGLPQATLAAIIIAAVIGLVDWRGFREIWRLDPSDAQLAVVGFAAVTLLGVLPGILVAVIASLLALVRRAYRPRISVLGRAVGETSSDEDFLFRSVARHPEYATIPGLVLFRFSNELFFANASYFRDETLRLVAEADEPRTVLVDAAAVTHVDTTAVAMLAELVDGLQRRGITFELARLPRDAKTTLERAGLLERLGPDGVHRSIHTGVTAYLGRAEVPTPERTPPAAAPAAPS